MSEPDNTKLNRHSIIYRGLSNGAQGRRGGGDGAQGIRVGRLCTGEKKGGNGAQGRRVGRLCTGEKGVDGAYREWGGRCTGKKVHKGKGGGAQEKWCS